MSASSPHPGDYNLLEMFVLRIWEKIIKYFSYSEPILFAWAF